MNQSNLEKLAVLSSIIGGISQSEYNQLKEKFLQGLPFDRIRSVVKCDRIKEKVNLKTIDLVKNEYDEIKKRGVHILYPGHEDYPVGFFRVDYPPQFISYIGKPCWKTLTCLSVVGSRKLNEVTFHWLKVQLSDLIRENKEMALVSGAARGTDQCVHRICLLQEKPTIAFLPSGLNCIYPSSFSSWVEPIKEFGGAILSEYPLNRVIKKHHFYQRNRLIASIGCGLLVAQASRRSGTMLTANICIKHGLSLSVIPAHPGDSTMQANLDLLSIGVQPIRDVQDLRVFVELNKKWTMQ